MNGHYDVALYNGRLSYRWISEFNTTIYSDEVVASFDTEIDAKNFVTEYYDSYLAEYHDSLEVFA